MTTSITPTGFKAGVIIAVLFLLGGVAALWATAWYVSQWTHWALGLPIALGALVFVHRWHRGFTSAVAEWRHTGTLTL
jgi:hypothetical protein